MRRPLLPEPAGVPPKPGPRQLCTVHLCVGRRGYCGYFSVIPPSCGGFPPVRPVRSSMPPSGRSAAPGMSSSTWPISPRGTVKRPATARTRLPPPMSMSVFSASVTGHPSGTHPISPTPSWSSGRPLSSACPDWRSCLTRRRASRRKPSSTSNTDHAKPCSGRRW